MSRPALVDASWRRASVRWIGLACAATILPVSFLFAWSGDEARITPGGAALIVASILATGICVVLRHNWWLYRASLLPGVTLLGILVVAGGPFLRARIPVLLNSGTLLAAAAASLLGLIALLVIGQVSRHAIVGIVVGAAILVIILESGVMIRLLPANYESPPRYWLVVIAALFAAASLWYERRSMNINTRDHA